ncbi:PRC-barrel domain-containing protein [Kitasatospora sp. NPDC006697]|uniref:PRC-barrel domain-containing protein n=1 Tax=Kitasatospora sp. NPDC006697 TaxID=3364020 RepID=UPI0036A22145
MESIMWEYQENSGYLAGTDLTGYRVEAADGHIGKVDKHSDDVDARYIVVDTGPWIFGKHVLLPAGTVISVDSDNETIQVNRTKEEIKNSPEFDKEKHTDDADYRQQVDGYYHGTRPY